MVWKSEGGRADRDVFLSVNAQGRKGGRKRQGHDHIVKSKTGERVLKLADPLAPRRPVSWSERTHDPLESARRGRLGDVDLEREDGIRLFS